MRFKKTQVSLEFILLTTFMLFVFLVFLGVVQYRMAEIAYEKELELLKGVADFIKNEINLAYTAEDGYYRVFEIPVLVAGRPYSIEIVQNNIYGLELRYQNQTGSVYVTLPVLDLETEPVIKPGKNIIQKKHGRVILN